MEISTQNISDLNVMLTVKINQNDYEPIVEKQLKKTRQTAQIKGFRQGMAPMNLIKKFYGQTVLFDELNKILTEELNKYVEGETRKFIGEPIPYEEKQSPIDWENQKDFEFVYEVGFYPEISLDLNKRISVTYYEIHPDSSETDKEVDYYRKHFGKVSPVDIIEDDDMIKAETLLNDVEKEISFLIKMIPEDQRNLFIGLKVGEKVDVSLKTTFTNPADLQNMLAISAEEVESLPENLTITIKEVTRVMPSEINQEFFDKVTGEGKVSSEEEFRAFLEEQAKEYYNRLSDSRLTVDAQEVLEKKAKIELPLDFLKRLFVYLNRDRDVTEDNIENSMPLLVNDLSRNYVINYLLEKYEIKITEEEILTEAERSIRERLRMYGMYNANVDQFVQQILQNREEVDKLVSTIKAEKLSQLVKEKVKLNIKEVSIEEFNNLYKDANKELENE